MNLEEPKSAWVVQQTLLYLSNAWLTLVGERLQPPNTEAVDYWRIEKADSAIVLPVWRGQVILPAPMYRPGLGEATLDLPGGRVAEGQTPLVAARQILQRELGIEDSAIASLTPLNTVGWPVNSSFSNQRLFGFLAQLQETGEPTRPLADASFPYSPAGLEALLKQLSCLQCRAVVMEVRWR